MMLPTPRQLLARIDQAFLPHMPAARLSAVRIVVGIFVAATSAGILPSTLRSHPLGAAAFRPVGVLAMLGEPPSWALVLAVNLLGIVGGALLAIGWRHAVMGPIAALAFLFIATYRSSWGMIFHSEN